MLIHRVNELYSKKYIKKFVLYPFGHDAVFVKEFLDNREDVDYIMVDHFKKGEGIKDIDAFCDERYKDYCILILSGDMKFYNDLRSQIYDVVKDRSRVIDLFEIPSLNISYDSYIGGGDGNRNEALERAAIEIYINNVKGNVAEAGVFQGDFASVINSVFNDRRTYLIDTFEGFDNRDIDIEHKNLFSVDHEGGWKYTEYQLIVDRMINKDIKVLKGYVPEVLNSIEDTFAFVSLDMDLYNPTYGALEFFYTRLEAGGYIFVHDCLNSSYLGSRRAVIDYCTKEKVGYVIIPDGCGTAVIAKPL